MPITESDLRDLVSEYDSRIEGLEEQRDNEPARGSPHYRYLQGKISGMQEARAKLLTLMKTKG